MQDDNPTPNVNPSTPPPPVSATPPVPAQNVYESSQADPAPATAVTTGNDASVNDRLIAFLIDWGVSIAIVIAASITSWVVGQVSGILASLVSMVGFFAAGAYFYVRDCLPQLDGVSIGKKAMKIRAVTTDGQPLTGNWMPGLMRNVIFLIPFFVLVELFILFSRKDKHPLQRLGDEWFNTKVIKTN